MPLHFRVLLSSVYVRLIVSNSAHVFMRSCPLVQLVTLAQHVAQRNTTDVQMFLLGKQTERPFSPWTEWLSK